MKEQLVSFETAKLASKARLDITCDKIYTDPNDKNSTKMFTRAYHAPTQSLLQKVLREREGVMVWVEPTQDDICKFICHIVMNNGMHKTICGDDDTWESILEQGLQEALKMIT